MGTGWERDGEEDGEIARGRLGRERGEEKGMEWNNGRTSS